MTRLRMLLAVSFGLATASYLVAQSVEKMHPRVFQTLQSRCVKCHHHEHPRGGLDLQSQDAAMSGGDSQAPILGGDLEENELWQRVSTDDLTLRMPKQAPALPPAELDAIRAWIEAGSPWPDSLRLTLESETTDDASQPTGKSSEKSWTDTLIEWEKRTDLVPYRNYWVGVFFVVNLLFLANERRKASKQRRQAQAAKEQPTFLDRIDTFHYLAFVGLSVLSFACVMQFQLLDRSQSDVASLESKIQELRKIRPGQDLDDSGKFRLPMRPRHATGVTKTYYRGNCETNDQLWNQGNYCTAMFDLQLIDAEGNFLAVGDPLPDGQLLVRFTMRRAPGATQKLFDAHVIETLFFTPIDLEFDSTVDVKTTQEDRIAFETKQKDWQWQATLPLNPGQDDEIAGHWYLGKGAGNKRTTIHYAIVYQISVEDGTIAAGSDIWMGPMYAPSAVQATPPGKLPAGEWFSTYPLPVIEGDNATDEKLLGVEEHLGVSDE